MASRAPVSSDFLQGSTTAINTILAEEANRIGADVHKQMLHTSPWIDLVKKSAFPDGMGYQLTTLIYDRSLPTTDAGGDAVGLNWHSVGGQQTSGNDFNVSLTNQPLEDAANNVQGPNGSGSDQRNYINFSKKLREYSIKRAIIESPRINIDDLRYAAHRQEQLRAVIDNLADATRHSWAERYRDEFDRLSDCLVACADDGSSFFLDNGGVTTDTSVAAGGDTISGTTQITDANISNAVLDKIYFQLIRKGAGREAYGRENGRPVFGLVLSSEASYSLLTESTNIRDDIRYNNAAVSELLKPLGVERSFRGFYHLVDDIAPRYTDGADGVLTRVQPYNVTDGITTVNNAYDNAEYEVAYVIHPEVFESQIPQPFGGTNGLTFNPVNYSGDFKWTNILSEATNPDGTIGFFRGILACASKPIKTEFGYAILYKRAGASATV
jgi:hypothetical protein